MAAMNTVPNSLRHKFQSLVGKKEKNK